MIAGGKKHTPGQVVYLLVDEVFVASGKTMVLPARKLRLQADVLSLASEYGELRDSQGA